MLTIFNIPLAWMLGPMIVTSIAALADYFNKLFLMPKIALSSILIILGLAYWKLY